MPTKLVQVVSYVDKDIFDRMELQRKKNRRMSISWFIADAIEEKVIRMEKEEREKARSLHRRRASVDDQVIAVSDSMDGG